MPQRSKDPIKAGARRAKAHRRAGDGAHCTDCGETNPSLLVRSSRPRRCKHCHAISAGKKPIESHHIAARANSPVTIDVPINDHQLLSEAQREWPPRTMQNPDGSPLIALAGSLRGLADLLGELFVRFMHSLADLAESVDGWLRHQYGPWWKGTQFDGWQPG
jgi:hypothetical protein